MSPNTHQHTAKIYQFPKRMPAQTARRGFDLAPVADPRQRLALSVDCGAGWYHDRAIEDARAAGKP